MVEFVVLLCRQEQDMQPEVPMTHWKSDVGYY